jgi:hypothetical protein
MPGHSGNSRVTIQNLTIVDIKPDQNLLLIKGAVPGATNSIVIIKEAKKRKAPQDTLQKETPSQEQDAVQEKTPTQEQGAVQEEMATQEQEASQEKTPNQEQESAKKDQD